MVWEWDYCFLWTVPIIFFITIAHNNKIQGLAKYDNSGENRGGKADVEKMERIIKVKFDF